MKRAQIFHDMCDRVYRKTDRVFAKLLLAQWVFAIVLALVISPFSYNGGERTLHPHVLAAVWFGGLINVLPLTLVRLRPGWWGTRQTIAVVQMLWSALLIMITGGRIETHFHVFGSLAFLAFYRDWKLLPTATIVVAVDHLARGLWWPDSVYGTLDPEWWRFLEHAGWVAFEDVVLAYGCIRAVSEMWTAAVRETVLENAQSVTEKQVGERTRRLQQTMERYRALVENTAAIPFELDIQTLKVLYIAPQATQLFECTMAQIKETDMFGLIHPDDLLSVRKTIAVFSAGHTVGAIDYRVLPPSGRTLYLRTLLSSRDNGRIRGITFDMTREKRLELDLQQAQKLESVGRLAAGVAHEINTPIQFVGDSVEFVREAALELLGVVDPQRAAEQGVDLEYLTTEIPPALDRMADGIERVAVIVRSMKVFSHSTGEAGDVDLNRTVTSTLAIARNEYKHIADVETELGTLPTVRGHNSEINQVVLNLVLNAAHAVGDRVKAGAIRGRITIRTYVEGDSAVLAVSDTGTGIPEAIRDQIFDPFFTTKPVGKGTGQGLSIARSVIVDKHNGSLTFDSEIGVGTTFYVRLPIAVMEKVAA